VEHAEKFEKAAAQRCGVRPSRSGWGRLGRRAGRACKNRLPQGVDSEDMTPEREADQRQAGAELLGGQGETAVASRASADASGTSQQRQRDPLTSLTGCERILVLGRTGSGKTTLARELAAALDVPHVELDSLYFGPDFSTAPLSLLRERTSAAIAADRWVTDGNKRAVRDLVWPRADTAIWLDYSAYVSLWRLAKRARARTSALSAQAAQTGRRAGLPKQMLAAARGVLTALRSHRGQRREYPRMFAHPANQHLAVARLRSPRATRQWMARVTEVARPPA
jgi:energy-coupling factor transporter ATP-binding protein EcfA2